MLETLKNCRKLAKYKHNYPLGPNSFTFVSTKAVEITFFKNFLPLPWPFPLTSLKMHNQTINHASRNFFHCFVLNQKHKTATRGENNLYWCSSGFLNFIIEIIEVIFLRCSFLCHWTATTKKNGINPVATNKLPFQNITTRWIMYCAGHCANCIIMQVVFFCIASCFVQKIPQNLSFL